jgi:U3 small nucleolar RNA-associated protein 15
VLVYDATTNEVDKSLSRFKDVAYGATYRADGRLLACGGAHPLVQVFDVESRTLLRSLRGHSGAVRVTRFASDQTRVVSMSDDRSVRSWDLASEAMLTCVADAHSDYVRGGAASRVSPDVWYSGSYDRT